MRHIGLLLVVIAFMVLSLFVTATGRARFAQRLRYTLRSGQLRPWPIAAGPASVILSAGISGMRS
jgi:hypothetical protein